MRCLIVAGTFFPLLAGHLGGQDERDTHPPPGYGTIEPYSLELSALLGQTATDVYARIVPIPEYSDPTEADKVLLKSFTAEGDAIRWTRSWKNVALAGGTATLSFQDLERYSRLDAQVSVKTAESVNTEVLRAGTIVLLRPDLTIPSVQARPEVRVGEPVNVEVVVRERNQDLGATFDGVLEENGKVLDRVEGASVTPGGLTSLAFTLVFTQPGVHRLRALIQDADPGEYDENNNAFEFEIAVRLRTQSMGYDVGCQDSISHSVSFPFFLYGTELESYENLESFWYSMDLPTPIVPAKSFQFQMSIHADGASVFSMESGTYGPAPRPTWYWENLDEDYSAIFYEANFVYYFADENLMVELGDLYTPWSQFVVNPYSWVSACAAIWSGLIVERYAGEAIWISKGYSRTRGLQSSIRQWKRARPWHARSSIQTHVVLVRDGVAYGGWSDSFPVRYTQTDHVSGVEVFHSQSWSAHGSGSTRP